MKNRLFALVFFLVVFTGLAGAQVSATRLTVSGLKDEVTVQRDARGIPYIEAKNDADLYFAQGYVTASDRLWQMDMMRRLARGETTELTGNLTLEEDKRWRRFGLAQIAEKSLAELSPQLRAALEDYSRGFNAYIATLDEATIPPEFKILQYKPKQWSPSDTVIIGKILADALSTTWRFDLLRASLSKTLSAEKFADVNNQVTPYDVILFGSDGQKRAASMSGFSVPDKVLVAAEKDEQIRASSLSKIGLYAEDLAASNNWVISGKRTADGKPILANDPHLAPTAPGIWYMAHLSTPTMRVSGVTFPGVPGIVLGHNENIAWGATNVGPDVQDLYEEKVEIVDGVAKYKTPNGLENVTVRKETINVRKNPLKTETEPVTLEVQVTSHGPIILSEGGKSYSLKWTALDPKNNEFEAFFNLNRAKNWDDFKAALKTYGGATQNFVYADVKGHIGWYAAGRIPIRRLGDGAMPYDGSTTDGDWIGYIPFDELPHLYDPPSGLIVTANQRIVGTSYKYTQVSRDAATPWRARRILDSLDAKRKVTMDDVRDVQYDALNMPLDNIAKFIVKNGSGSADTLAVLKDWDGKMTPDSRAALLVNEIRNCVAGKIADDNKPLPVNIVRERVLDRALRENLTRWLPPGASSFNQLFKDCDGSVRTSLADPKRFGPDPAGWTWGKVWQSRFSHPLASVPFVGGQFATPVVAINGSGQTPNVGSAVSMRHIASPGNWDATRHVIPLGQSGDPRSPHYKDQFDAWKDGTPVVFPFTKNVVSAAAKETVVMSPR